MSLHDPEAEACLIAKATVSPAEAMDLDITAEDFYAPKNQAMWKALEYIASRDDTPTLGLVLEASEVLELGLRDEDWFNATNTLPTLPVQSAKRVRELSARRRARATALQIANLCESGQDFTGLIADLEGSASDSGGKLYTEKQLIEAALEDTISQTTRQVISLGWKPLVDEIGMCPEGSMIVVGARPNVGKTTLCHQIVDSCASQGVPSLMVSVEDPKILSGHKLVGRISGIDPSVLRDHVMRDISGNSAGSKLSRDDWDDIMRAAKVAATKPRPLYYLDSVGDHIKTILSSVRAAVRKHKIKVVCVDYIQTIRGGAAQSHRLMIDNMARALKRLAAKEGFVLVLASQLKRGDGGEFKQPTMADLKESGTLEEMAEAVLLLWKTSEEDGQVRCKVGKLKWSRAGGFFAFERGKGGELVKAAIQERPQNVRPIGDHYDRAFR